MNTIFLNVFTLTFAYQTHMKCTSKPNSEDLVLLKHLSKSTHPPSLANASHSQSLSGGAQHIPMEVK